VRERDRGEEERPCRLLCMWRVVPMRWKISFHEISVGVVGIGRSEEDELAAYEGESGIKVKELMCWARNGS
jgi:hypothetical protein